MTILPPKTLNIENFDIMLCDVWEPSDVWTGISDQSRRKKLQNKLNQRAYR